MAFSTIRQATDDDTVKLNARAASFIKRHSLTLELAPASGGELYRNLEDQLFLLSDYATCAYIEPGRQLTRLWRRIVKRAIGGECIAWGYVGCIVN